jgi:hypothetical protein
LLGENDQNFLRWHFAMEKDALRMHSAPREKPRGEKMHSSDGCHRREEERELQSAVTIRLD